MCAPETKPKKSNPKGAGRKLFDGKDEQAIIRKLEQVWAMGGSDEEAAFYAEISKASLSEYLSRTPEISERKEALKEKPILKARQTVIKDLDTPSTAQWYLERKRKNEFGVREQLGEVSDLHLHFHKSEKVIQIVNIAEDELRKELERNAQHIQEN